MTTKIAAILMVGMFAIAGAIVVVGLQPEPDTLGMTKADASGCVSSGASIGADGKCHWPEGFEAPFASAEPRVATASAQVCKDPAGFGVWNQQCKTVEDWAIEAGREAGYDAGLKAGEEAGQAAAQAWLDDNAPDYSGNPSVPGLHRTPKLH